MFETAVVAGRPLAARHRLLHGFVLHLLALACFLASHTAGAATTVLVLYSNGRLVPGNVDVERGLRAEGGLSVRGANKVFAEFLDRPEFGGADHERTITTYLRDKYAALPPDLVIAVANDSLEFLLRHRAQLFPGVPVVHAAVYRSYLQSIPALPADVVGVPVEYDPAGTIEQALRWHPQARRLVVVTGATTRDREWEALLRATAAPFRDRVEVEFLAGLPTPAVLKRLGELGPESVVYTAGYYQGGDDLKFTPRDSAEAMARVSGAPVYGSFSSFIGTGAVGGLFPSFEAMGRQAGQVASQLLGGTAAASLQLPQVMPNELTIDWRQANRWGISDAQIPAGAVVHFREPTFWQTYRGTALTVIAVILLQAALIARLLLERRRRRQAELAVLDQRTELAHASRLAVAGELTASIAHEINQPLGAILASADAAEMLLQSGADRRDDLLRIVSRIRRDDLRASDVIQRLRSLLAKHAPERQAIDLNAALVDVATLLRGMARHRQATLEFEPAPTPVVVEGDPVQIQQVLINLILNAMDAVAGLPEERRMVKVSLTLRATDARITVRDRGHGIAAEHLPKLFDSFFSTKQKGMGLGLSIARTIVEAHGGHIRAENSGHGEGSAFHVELPLHAITGTSTAALT